MRLSEDEAGQLGDHPGTPLVGTLYLQKAAHAGLGAPNRIIVTNRGQTLGRAHSQLTGPAVGQIRIGRRAWRRLVRRAAPGHGQSRQERQWRPNPHLHLSPPCAGGFVAHTTYYGIRK